MPVILGTAGHIDHGKTSLINALTDINCDRLIEEKKRGITIELGFAFLNNDDGERLSIIDVPGHERFVKNMVAGASGIDLVLLVIAADEGIMPQTKEHLEICSLLGIKQGLIALTKTDLVEQEWLDLVQEEIKDFLKGSFLENADIFPVSVQTGSGLESLKKELLTREKNLRNKKRSDLFRLPIDRIFSLKGHGTVVTGTMIAGQVKNGEELTVYPKEKNTKVRSLHSHDKNVEIAEAGGRTAINLSNLEVSDIQKGEVLARPDSLFPSLHWDIKLTCLSSTPTAIKHRTEIHFHHGTKETLARLYFFDRDKLNPGETALCQVRFTEPMVGVFGDRCVIRAYSPLRTIAGAELLNPLSLELKKKDPLFQEKTEKLLQLGNAEAKDLILMRLELAEKQGLNYNELLAFTNLNSKTLEKELALLNGKQELSCFDKEEKRYIAQSIVQALENSALSFINEFHKQNPAKNGLGKNEFYSGWGASLYPKLLHFLLERLSKKKLLHVEGDLVRIPSHQAKLETNQQDIKTALLNIYKESDKTPLNIKEILESLALNQKEALPLLKNLQDSGELVKISDEIYYYRPVLDKIWEAVTAWFESNDDLNLAVLKDLTSLSRKYLIALLEYFDREKLTVRVGDKRLLRGSKK
ncbi:selenocysteine-specific translation elongation factor [Desulfovibrio litoralis]|uniref:Selenocysteine-specific elongation factor n=1 Tax=Desulfovibrio litoralis DSM 11393 TaxID=1121455 RepID=A0A1M7SFL0_9BACT|nr:selenocysteine-specific translation elongation factor [Desulfovibrio litoralis]SHN57308.1 selenocysteine-specific translation elongation factor SelB [Desulfovibrio litoralis DSM 11393]